jgi:probable phosphoglycerate mutase
MSARVKTIYFVRHGESTLNARSTPRNEGGQSPLTELGAEQATAVAERAARLPVQALIASTMVRAQETAQRIAEKIGKPIESSDLFVERKDPSAWMGRLWDEPGAREDFAEWEETLFTSGVRMLDGENFDDIELRARQALACLEARPESEILVVTHGFFMRVLVGVVVLQDSFSGAQLRVMNHSMKTRNTGITVLRYDPTRPTQWHMLVWNDHAHLG